VVDEYPNPEEPRELSLRFAKTNELVGIDIDAEEQQSMLERLELVLKESGKEQSRFSIPSFRVDLKREVDLIEEVVRLYGVDKIPSTPPRGAVGTHEYDAVHDDLSTVRRLLVGMGLTEIQGQTLVCDSAVGIPKDGDVVPLEYPLSSDMNILRPSLLPGILTVLQHNANHGTQDVAVFELGGVFGLKDSQPLEQRRLGLALIGSRAPAFWSASEGGEEFDLSDLKGRLEDLLESLGLRGIQWKRAASSDPLFVEEGQMTLGKQVLGRFGQMQPVTASKMDLKRPVLLGELDLDLILKRRSTGRSFKALPQFPSIRRDVAMLVDESVAHDDVLRAVKKAKADFLHTVDIFDVFRGKGIPEGKKSVAYAFVYRDRERTLKDDEVTSAHAKVIERLKQDTAAEIR
jgi:phenylalanyl-tRNA synthetase beta chain